MSNLDSGFSKAQRAYDRMEPPESLVHCPKCNDKGSIEIDCDCDTPCHAKEDCLLCDGVGMIPENDAEEYSAFLRVKRSLADRHQPGGWNK